MNADKTWEVFNSMNFSSPEFFSNETVTRVISILDFIEEKHDDVGFSMYSISINDMASELGLSTSSLYRYMQNIVTAKLVSIELNKVQVYQEENIQPATKGRIFSAMFKDIEGNEIMPNKIDSSSRIFKEAGETTIKRYSLTERGNKVLEISRSMISLL